MSAIFPRLLLAIRTYIGKFWVALVLVVCTAYAVKFVFDIDIDPGQVKLVSSPSLFLAALMHIVFWLILSYTWSRVIGLHYHKKLNMLECFAQVSIVNIGKYMPGKIWGMVARGKFLNDRNIPVEKIIRSTYIEQLTFIHAAVLLSIAILAVLHPGLTGLISLLSIIAVTYMLAKHQHQILSLVSKMALKLLGKRYLEHTETVATADYIKLVLLYSLVWLLSGLTFLFLSFAFLDLETTFRILLLLILVNTTSIATGFLAFFSPGGLGVREVVGSTLLVTIMPISDAIILMSLYRIWVTIADLLGGAIAVYLSRSGSIR